MSALPDPARRRESRLRYRPIAKKSLAVLLSLALILPYLPAPTFAEDTPRPEWTVEELSAAVDAFEKKFKEAGPDNPLYSEHTALDFDKELAELESRCKSAGKDKLLKKLLPYRAKLAPDYYRDRVLEDPALYEGMRFTDFVELRNAAADGQFPVFFRERKVGYRKGADRPDFVLVEGSDARPLTTAETLALWKDFQSRAGGAGDALHGEMRQMYDRLGRIEQDLKAGGDKRAMAAHDLARVFDNMNKTNLLEMAELDPALFRDLMYRMNKTRSATDQSVQRWLDRQGSVREFDEKLFDLKDDPDMAQVHSLMRGLQPPPELVADEALGDPEAATVRWWDAFTVNGKARLARDTMTSQQVDLSMSLLWKGPDGQIHGFGGLPPEAQDLIKRGEALENPLDREAWLVEAHRYLDRHETVAEFETKARDFAKRKAELEAEKGKPIEEMTDEELQDPKVQELLAMDKALFEFKEGHKDFLEKYSRAKGMAADYSMWLQQTLPTLQDGTRLDSRMFGIAQKTLPHFNEEIGWLVKNTRTIFGKAYVGLEYTTNFETSEEKGKRTRFWTMDMGPGGVPVQVNYVLDDKGAVVRREFYLPDGEGGIKTVAETGTFDERGRLTRGTIKTEGKDDVDGLETVEKVLEDGKIQRTRRYYQVKDRPEGEKVIAYKVDIELFSPDPERRLLLKFTGHYDKDSGKKTKTNTVWYGKDGDIAGLENEAYGDDPDLPIHKNEWFKGRRKPSGYIYDPETGKEYAAGDPANAEHIERIVKTLDEYAPRWINRVTNRVTNVKKTLLVGLVDDSGEAPILIGPGLYEIRSNIDTDNPALSFQFELGPLKGLPRTTRLGVLKEFVEQAYQAVHRYQPQVIAIGFWGANDIAENPQALIAFLEEILEESDTRGWDSNVILDAKSGLAPYLVTFVDPEDGERTPQRRYLASFRELAGYGSNPWGAGKYNKDKSVPAGLTVYSMHVSQKDGKPVYEKGSLPLRHIVSPTEKYLPKYITKTDNAVTGTDLSNVKIDLLSGGVMVAIPHSGWEIDLNTLLGTRIFERLDFVQGFYNEDGSFKGEGHTVIGDWEQIYSGPNALSVIWDSVDKAGETIVAFAGVAIGSVIYAGAAVYDLSTTGMEEAVAAALELAGDKKAADAYRQQLAGIRAFRRTFRDEVGKSVISNAIMNPLVKGWRDLGMSESQIAELEKQYRDNYLFEAPNVMAKEAVASDSWYGKAFWGGMSGFTNFGLQTGKGLAVYGPLGGIGRVRPWVVNGKPQMGALWSTVGGRAKIVMGQLNAPRSFLAAAYNTTFHYGMLGMAGHGGYETTFGEHGVIESGRHLWNAYHDDLDENDPKVVRRFKEDYEANKGTGIYQGAKNEAEAKIRWLEQERVTRRKATELELYQSLNNFTAATVPFLAGAIANLRGRGGKARSQPKETSDARRVVLAETVLEQKATPIQRQAILDSHRIGMGEPGLDGKPAKVGNYTQKQILQKARILREAGFTQAQIRTLMEAKIVGIENAPIVKTDTARGPPAETTKKAAPVVEVVDQSVIKTGPDYRAIQVEKAIGRPLTTAERASVLKATRETWAKKGEGDINRAESQVRAEAILKQQGFTSEQITKILQTEAFLDTRVVDIRSVRPSQNGVGMDQVKNVADRAIGEFSKHRKANPDMYKGLSEARALNKWLNEVKFGENGEAIPAFITPEGKVMVTDSHHRGSALLQLLDKVKGDLMTEMRTKNPTLSEAQLSAMVEPMLPKLRVKVLGDYTGQPPADFYRALKESHNKGEFGSVADVEYRIKLKDLEAKTKRGTPEERARAQQELNDLLVKMFEDIPQDFRSIPDIPMRSAVGNTLFRMGVEGGLYFDYFEFKVFQFLESKATVKVNGKNVPVTMEALVELAKARAAKFGKTIGTPPEGDPFVHWELRKVLLEPGVMRKILGDPRKIRVKAEWGTPEQQAAVQQEMYKLSVEISRQAYRMMRAEASLHDLGVSDSLIQEAFFEQPPYGEFAKRVAKARGTSVSSLDPGIETQYTAWQDSIQQANALKKSKYIDSRVQGALEAMK